MSWKNGKPYLELGFTLALLADKLDISPLHLSQVINENLGKSYFDFVNEYRVQETKKVLTSPEAERFSILGIALDAGFNSKSAFYTAFKKHAGMTPTQFKDRLARPEQPPVQDPR
jgi:AraC-like DNA-binding protein